MGKMLLDNLLAGNLFFLFTATDGGGGVGLDFSLKAQVGHANGSTTSGELILSGTGDVTGGSTHL